MKIEMLDKDSYKIFINNSYKDISNIDDKGELGKFIKSIILEIRKIYDILLEGLYEVHVYVIKFIGMILEVKNIDSYLSKTVDLKIIVHSDEDTYLKIKNYDLVNGYSNIKYFNNSFYINANQLLEKDIYSLIEDYKVIYGKDLKEMRSKWRSLTI